MSEILRPDGCRWVGRRNKWVSFPYVIRRIGRWWKITVQLESGSFVRLPGRYGPLQDAMDAAEDHKHGRKQDEPELDDPSADAAVQEHVQEDTSPIEVGTRIVHQRQTQTGGDPMNPDEIDKAMKSIEDELGDDPGLVASPDPTAEAEEGDIER